MSDRGQHMDEPFDLEREPLERPGSFATDWGGDGSDRDRPVRAHVLAALQPAAGPYAPPLDALLALGDVPPETLEQRAAELGIGQAHVPELVRMTRDRALNTAESDSPEVWAPMHALDLLKRLDLSRAVADLLPIFDLDFDRMTDELIGIVAAAGPAAVPPAAVYMRDRTRWGWGRSRVADVLQTVAERHPETREEVVAALRAVLTDAESDEELAVTGAMGALVELQAAETLPLIRRAFELGKIDESVFGPWGQVLEELGIAPAPDDPLIAESRARFEARHKAMFPADLRENMAAFQERHRAEQARVAQRAAAQRRSEERARKEKRKRKAASAARKANRRRK